MANRPNREKFKNPRLVEMPRQRLACRIDEVTRREHEARIMKYRDRIAEGKSCFSEEQA